MKKSNPFAALAAFLLSAVILLSGCGGKKLSKEEYMEAVRTGFKSYVMCVSEMSDALDTENYSSIKEIAERAEKTLSEIESAVPEEKYAAQHKKLCDSISSEREWFKNCVKFSEYGEKKDSLTPAEAEELSELNKKLENTSEAFPEIVLETVKLLQSD